VPVSAEPEVPITDLITDDFIHRHTDFPDAGTFWLAAGFGGIPTASELDRLDSEEFDEFVRESTPFLGALEFLLMARAEAEAIVGGDA
jgi:hypothetical protein